eukprot:15364449-Ditylum_brightwellii.AAC.1
MAYHETYGNTATISSQGRTTMHNFFSLLKYSSVGPSIAKRDGWFSCRKHTSSSTPIFTHSYNATYNPNY